MKYTSIPVFCDYIHVNEGYDKLIEAIGSGAENGDIVIISETPISIIEGNVVDESKYNYGILSLLITEVWCKFFWGYVLGLLNYNRRTINNLKRMPIEARCHKEFILREYGLKYALMPSGEAGVDLSNVPDAFVSLLPDNPENSAFLVKDLLFERYGLNVDVMIIDTDPTYDFFGKLFTSIPKSIDGIINDMGIYGYLLRFFSKYEGATPLASTFDKNVLSLINLSNIAEKCQENNLSNYFETIYNMTDRFNVEIDEISDDMLKEISHIPAVIIRSNYL